MNIETILSKILDEEDDLYIYEYNFEKLKDSLNQKPVEEKIEFIKENYKKYKVSQLTKLTGLKHVVINKIIGEINVKNEGSIGKSAK